MKKLLVGLMVVVMGLLLMSPVASAYPVSVGDHITLNSAGSIGNANNGGAFWFTGGTTSAFSTFCVEMNEHVSWGGSFWVGSITDGAINGGLSGQDSTGTNDPLSSQAAYLYSRWASPWISGGIANTAANANALQLAIWAFEGEVGSPLGSAPTDSAALVLYNQAIAAAGAVGTGTDLYGVQVINLYTTRSGDGTTTSPFVYSGLAQDMLVTNQAPEPATMLLFVLGLLGLAGLRRRFKK
jgi:hypothetical protein